MADRKTSRDKPSEFYRVEATAHLTTELDKEFEVNYPLAKKGGGELLEKITRGEIPFFSFNISGGDKAFLSQIITTALKRATNPEDYSFSIHGDSGHETYKEALGTVIQHIEKGDIEVQVQNHDLKVETVQGKLDVPINRFVLITPTYERQTKRPYPHDYALKLTLDSRAREAGGKAKLLRKAVLENGVAFGIMAGFYSGETINSTLDLFADPNFRKSILAKFGAKEKIPSRSRGEDIKLLADTASKLTVPTSSGRKASPSPERYLEALDMLAEKGYLSREDNENSPYRFLRVVDTARAMVVLKGGSEAAQKIAPPELLPPVRTEYIDKRYGGVATSEVITAFLIINEG